MVAHPLPRLSETGKFFHCALSPCTPDRLTVPRILSTEGRKAAAAFLSNIALAFYERAIRSAAEGREGGREGGAHLSKLSLMAKEGRSEQTQRDGRTNERTYEQQAR